MIYVEGVPINVTKFPDGTSQVWKLKNSPTSGVIVTWEFENEAEVMHLIQLKMLLDEYNVRIIKLNIPYLPYARQDKDIDMEACFALKAFEFVLRALNLYYIESIDVHGEHDKTLINSMTPQIDHFFYKYTNIIFPDSGAYHRYLKGKSIPKGVNIVVFQKVRNVLSGEIVSIKPYSGEVMVGSKIIIDDICDGGATFISIAKLVGPCDLYVSHGLFTKGKQVLHEAGIEKIYVRSLE